MRQLHARVLNQLTAATETLGEHGPNLFRDGINVHDGALVPIVYVFVIVIMKLQHTVSHAENQVAARHLKLTELGRVHDCLDSGVEVTDPHRTLSHRADDLDVSQIGVLVVQEPTHKSFDWLDDVFVRCAHDGRAHERDCTVDATVVGGHNLNRRIRAATDRQSRRNDGGSHLLAENFAEIDHWDDPRGNHGIQDAAWPDRRELIDVSNQDKLCLRLQRLHESSGQR
mmetsp:Transcript_14198/g.40517  ORF Transcript_14198/g.40517 Transcript_14198/m.40517 type:complete len:227 (-) Transcript_14198:1875-2555(-)